MTATGAADRGQRTPSDSQSAAAHPRVSEFYACFNERRFDDAAAMFAADAVVKQAPAPQPRRGGTGYLEFAGMWIQGFPDATVAIERVFARTSALYEIELTATARIWARSSLAEADSSGPPVSAPRSLRQLLQLDDQNWSPTRACPSTSGTSSRSSAPWTKPASSIRRGSSALEPQVH